MAFHHRRHLRELGAPGVEQFLTHLVVNRKVGASTQNQALQALLFLYRQVLGLDLPWLENVTRAPRSRRLPVVLGRSEVRSILAFVEGTPGLVAGLLYGGGLRLLEALRLRVKDVVFERSTLVIRDAKGGKDRVTILPDAIATPLRAHVARLHIWFDLERQRGAPGVSVPGARCRSCSATRM